MKVKRLEIKLTEYMYNLLVNACKSKQISKSEYVREVLTQELNKYNKETN